MHRSLLVSVRMRLDKLVYQSKRARIRLEQNISFATPLVRLGAECVEVRKLSRVRLCIKGRTLGATPRSKFVPGNDVNRDD